MQGYTTILPHSSRWQCWCQWICTCLMHNQEILDVYYLPRIHDLSSSPIPISVFGIDALHTNRKAGHGTIIAMGHYGRLPLFSTGVALAGVPVGFVIQRIDERNEHLNIAERAYLQKKVDAMCRIAGGRCIMVGDAMTSLYRGLKNGECIIILFDLPQPLEAQITLCRYMEGQLRVPNSIVRIASKTGANIVYGSVHNQKHGVQVTLRQLQGTAQQALHEAVAELEKDVRQSPWQWWQWPLVPHLWSSKEKD